MCCTPTVNKKRHASVCATRNSLAWRWPARSKKGKTPSALASRRPLVDSARIEVVRFVVCGGLAVFLAPGSDTYGYVWSAAFQPCKKRAKILKWRQMRPCSSDDSDARRRRSASRCAITQAVNGLEVADERCKSPPEKGWARRAVVVRGVGPCVGADLEQLHSPYLHKGKEGGRIAVRKKDGG
jgi:hypothetical protein